MRFQWQALRDDERGFVISAEMAVVGTVGTLAMVAGLECVSSAVVNELNDLSQAFGAMNQSYNYRAITKQGHARVGGAGFTDRGDLCDCTALSYSDVAGAMDASSGGLGANNYSSSALTAQSLAASAPEVIKEEVIHEEAVESANVVQSVKCPDDEGEIIEERIIRRRIKKSDCCNVDKDPTNPPIEEYNPPIEELNKSDAKKTSPKTKTSPQPKKAEAGIPQPQAKTQGVEKTKKTPGKPSSTK